MRPQIVTDLDLLGKLMDVLRTKGYDGASLNDLANSSGLKKASLYHRYPGGKKAIALAVLQFVDEWADEHVFGILENRSIASGKRLANVLENISAIYEAGTKACILRALSTQTGVELFGEELQAHMEKWVAAFGGLGEELGQSAVESESNAYKVLSLIQGSLVIAKTFKNTKAFEMALVEIKGMYTK